MVFLEHKHRPDGRVSTFPCELVARQDDLAVLRFVLPHAYHVGSLELPEGGLTYGFYWRGRPYNLYWWQDVSGKTLGYYFNLGDRLVISETELSWRDLWVDILVVPGQEPVVMDEEEVPFDLAPQLHDYLNRAREEVLHDWPHVITEAKELFKLLCGGRYCFRKKVNSKARC